jgi:hypothetical protein
MITAQKLQLIHEQRGYDYVKQIELPKNAWILSASGLGTPGEFLLVTINIFSNSNADKEIKEFLVMCHHNKEVKNIEEMYENLLFLNSFDIEDETYSVFEIIKE